MVNDDVEPLREILHRALARYLTVTPTGFKLIGRTQIQPSIEARILGFGGARTYYVKQRPECRSLNGVQSVTHAGRTCPECDLRSQCTPQVRLDLLVEGQPYRLLIANTTARNFLAYEMQLRQQGSDLAKTLHRIDVTNRGTWGELRFRLAR